MIKHVFLLLSALLLVPACTHTSGTSSEQEGVRADDAGEEDSILRTFEAPPVKKKPKPKAEKGGAEPGSPKPASDELDRSAEREDSLTSTLEPRKPRSEVEGEETEPEELDMSQVREDPILSEVDSKDEDPKKRKKKKKKKEGGESRKV